MAEWTYVSSRMGDVQPELRAIAQEVFEAAKAAGHEIWFIWGMGDSAEHSSGLAFDLMVRTEAAGDWVRDYLWSNRARLRLRHVIWWQHITSTVNQPGVRRKMSDRGNSTANHYDHVHGLFFAGPYRKPDGWVPVSNTNVPLTVDGKLGPKTIAKWQTVMGTKVDGKIDKGDSELIRAVQVKLKGTVDHRLEVDGRLGPKTIGALQRYLGTPVDQRISPENSTVIKALQRRLNEGRF